MTNNIIIIMYSILIIFGIIINSSIIIVYVTKQVPASTQNLLIVNLAISDLLLCILTMPMTVLDKVYFYFPFPVEDHKLIDIICKVVSSSQSVCVFFSSISVVLIAVDRFNFILNQHQGGNSEDSGNNQISPRCAFLLSFLDS